MRFVGVPQVAEGPEGKSPRTLLREGQSGVVSKWRKSAGGEPIESLKLSLCSTSGADGSLYKAAHEEFGSKLRVCHRRGMLVSLLWRLGYLGIARQIQELKLCKYFLPNVDVTKHSGPVPGLRDG